MSIDPLNLVGVAILAAMVIHVLLASAPDVYTGPGCDGP
jgi:hypothetical protein